MTCNGVHLRPVNRAAARLGPILLVILLALPAPSWARTRRQRAQAMLREGNALHDRGDYPGALERYRTARRLYPSYRLDLNIGLTLKAMGRSIQAAEQLERFLHRAGKIADASVVEAAREKLGELRRELSSVIVICPVSGGTVALDGAVVGQTPLDHRIYLKPGGYRISVKSPAHPFFSRVLFLRAGDHRRLEVPWYHEVGVGSRVNLRGPLPPPPGKPRDSGSTPIYRRWWFWTALGVVVVGGVVGGVVAARPGGSSRLPAGELGTLK